MSATIHHILKTYWKYDSFRPQQEEIISAVLNGKDTLALLPTGGGKSICFQVPALAREGICLVISPLIALMKDQVANLRLRGIPAEAIYTGKHPKEIDVILDNCIYGDIKFLYLSPERLQSNLFLERVQKMKVNLIAVDEAHCISQWGHEFRPAYVDIHQLKEVFPHIPTIALTASATNKVRADIIEKLHLVNPKVVVQSFARKNLSYSCFKTENKEEKLLQIISNVAGSGIVYVNSRKRTMEVSKLLLQRGISSDFYHGGLSTEARNKKQDSWIANSTRIMVCTNAFGMGIDKPDVRSVVHWEPPLSLEAYYQEAGRAGRDENKAYAVLLYYDEDLDKLTKQVEEHYPDTDFIKKVYQCLANYYKIAVGGSKMMSRDFVIDDFTKTFNLKRRETHHAIMRLQSEGYLLMNAGFHEPSKITCQIVSDELYKFEVANESFESVIKGLLRLFGGEIFNHYLPLHEERLAKLLGDHGTNQVIKKLQYLHKANILGYYPRKTKPQLIFLKGRIDVNELSVGEKAWHQLKETETKKLDAMKKYIETTRCRSLTIQYYFDEDSDLECGVCDTCLAKKQGSKLSLDEKELSQLILTLIEESQSISIADLVIKLKEKATKNEVIDGVQQLLKREIISHDDNQLLKLK
ncbi:MAG: ATP-dependent DNA helicase RecQ [Cyclobacteriaceae bacterium]